MEVSSILGDSLTKCLFHSFIKKNKWFTWNEPWVFWWCWMTTWLSMCGCDLIHTHKHTDLGLDLRACNPHNSPMWSYCLDKEARPKLRKQVRTASQAGAAALDLLLGSSTHLFLERFHFPWELDLVPQTQLGSGLCCCLTHHNVLFSGVDLVCWAFVLNGLIHSPHPLLHPPSKCPLGFVSGAKNSLFYLFLMEVRGLNPWPHAW